MPERWRRRLSTGWHLLRTRGVSGVIGKVVEKIGARLRGPEAWLLRKQEVDPRFDAQHGVDTGGVARLATLHIESPNHRFGIDHIASDPEEFERALAALSIRHEEFCFVDLGSGKGRALLMASKRPFRRLIGVEFARELHEVAQKNLADLIAERRLELHHGDAATHQLPHEPLVIFLYHPFGPEVMEQVAEQVRRSFAERPRPLYVLYTNPLAESVWTGAGFIPSARGAAFTLLTPPAAG